MYFYFTVENYFIQNDVFAYSFCMHALRTENRAQQSPEGLSTEHVLTRETEAIKHQLCIYMEHFNYQHYYYAVNIHVIN